MPHLRPADRTGDRLAWKLPTGQRVLRLVGGIVLSACAVMVVLGVTILEDELHGPLFAIYWSWCFLFAIVALMLALWDMILVRRAFKRKRRELFQDEFMTTEFVDKIRDAIRKDEEK